MAVRAAGARVQIAPLARKAPVELRIELFGAVQLQARIVDHDGAVRRQLSGVRERRLAGAIERVIRVDATPALPQVAVRRVELDGRILVSGVGLRERVAGLHELILAEEVKPGVEPRAIDRVRADGRRQAAGHFRKARRLPHVHAHHSARI